MATAAPHYTARSGWLWRQSTFLKKWKRKYFILTTTGELSYFDSSGVETPKSTINMNSGTTMLAMGKQLTDLRPPEGKSSDCLLRISNGYDVWDLCGDTLDETTAWFMALEQARMLPRAGPAPTIYSAPAVQTTYIPQPTRAVVRAGNTTYIHQTGGFPTQTVQYVAPGVQVVNTVPTVQTVQYVGPNPTVYRPYGSSVTYVNNGNCYRCGRFGCYCYKHHGGTSVTYYN